MADRDMYCAKIDSEVDTRERMLDDMNAYCKQKACINCVYYDPYGTKCACRIDNAQNYPTTQIKAWWDEMHKEQDVKVADPAVEHPSHYNRAGAMECIDEMVEVFGKEAVMGFCLCNIWKYRFRASDKNGEEDLKKSDWYMTKYMELKNK